MLHQVLQRLHMSPDEYFSKPPAVRMFIRASIRVVLEQEEHS